VKELHESKGYSISLLCSVAQLNRSSYYKWLNRTETELEIEDRELIGKIRVIEEQRRMRKGCTKAEPGSQAAENILGRDFAADAPDRKWLTDVTEFKYGMDDKAYLSAILDLGDKRIVSYVLGHFNNNQLVFETFDRAVNENPEAHPLFHSDRGFQYTSPSFKTKLREAEMTQSMSRVGCCIDNGPMEGFWGIIKREIYYSRKFTSREELVQVITNYIDYYNNRRYQRRLFTLAPMEVYKQLMAA
jgi:transposase InsO family protein